MSDGQKRDFSIFYSILAHVLLGAGLYYTATPKLPKEPEKIEAMLISEGMLNEMRQGHSDTSGKSPTKVAPQSQPAPNKTTIKPPKVSTPKIKTVQIAKPKKVIPKKTIPKPKKLAPVQPQKIKPEKTKPKKVKPRKPTPAERAVQKLKAEAAISLKKTQIQAEKLKKRQVEAAAKRKAFRDEQNRADDKKRKKHLEKIEQKKQREQAALAKIKQKEKQQHLEKFKRQQATLASQNKLRRAEIDKNNAQEIANEIANQNQNKQQGMNGRQGSGGGPKVNVGAIVNRYSDLIQIKVKSNWSRNTSQKITVPVKIRLSSSGAVLSVRVNSSSIDPALKASIEQAVRKSSPLPVPNEPAALRRFRSFTFKFRTY